MIHQDLLIKLFMLILVIKCHTQITQLTLTQQNQFYVTSILLCESSQMTMNFTMNSGLNPVDFLVYAGTPPADCDPTNVVYSYRDQQILPSSSLDYYTQFSCVNTNYCNITGRTASIIQGPTCFAFYNEYTKLNSYINYFLIVNCSQNSVQLSSIGVSAWSIHGVGNNG